MFCDNGFPEVKTATVPVTQIVGWADDSLAALERARMISKAPFDPEALIDAMAPLLGLDIPPDYRPGVVTNLQVTARFAALVLDDPLGDHAEPAPVFRA